MTAPRRDLLALTDPELFALIHQRVPLTGAWHTLLELHQANKRTGGHQRLCIYVHHTDRRLSAIRFVFRADGSQQESGVFAASENINRALSDIRAWRPNGPSWPRWTAAACAR